VAGQMAKRLETWPFATESQRQGARKMLDFRGHISHCVGLSVHDGGLHFRRPLAEGMVFSVDPSCWIGEEKVYVRCEDTIVVTANGIENLTSDAPLDLDATEAMIRQRGILQAFPPA
jgi:Xaa-Pro aminopeptidase